MEYLPCVGYWVGLWRYNKREKQVQFFSGLILKQTLIKELINTCTRRLWEGPPRRSPGAASRGPGELAWREVEMMSPELEGDGVQPGQGRRSQLRDDTLPSLILPFFLLTCPLP